MVQSARPIERSSDRWMSVVLSVLLHGTLVVVAAYGWWFYKQDRPTPTLAIEATVVDAKSIPGLASQPQPPPPAPAPPEPQPQAPTEAEGPPEPTPEELAKREQERKGQEEQVKQQEEDQKRLEQQREQEAALAEQKAAEEKRAQEQQRQAEEQAAQKAEAERKEREAAEAKKQEEAKRLAEEKRQAEERAQEQQANAEREADLKRSLDQELRQDAAQNSAAVATWQSQIIARIQRAWLQPASAKPGIVCVLDVTQVPGGTVTNVHVGSCNGDQAVRESIEAAVYRASPLPPPPDPALFQRELTITFRPN